MDADDIIVWDGHGNPSDTWTVGRMHPDRCACWFCAGAHSDWERRQTRANKRLRTYAERKPGTSPYERFQKALAKAATLLTVPVEERRTWTC